MRGSLVLGLAGAVLLVACTMKIGHDFTAPEAAALVVGSTSKSAVLARYGAPYAEKSSFSSDTDSAPKPPSSPFDAAQVSGSLTYLTYRYGESLPPIAGGRVQTKSAWFVFHNDVLVGYNSSSSFTPDSSDFDESRMSQLRKGETTEAEAITILGPPAGRAIYPVALIPGERKLFYNYAALDGSTRKAELKELMLLFGGTGRLVDFRFTSNMATIPYVPAPAPTAVPIVIPPHR